MGMPGVNAVVDSYAAVRYGDNGHPQSMLGMFDSLYLEDVSGDRPVLPEFRVVVRVCVIGDEADDGNVLLRRGRLAFRVRLTKCGMDGEARLGRDLAAFFLDFGDPVVADSIHTGGAEYVNYSHIVNIARLELDPGFGEYVVKLLVADASDGKIPVDEDFVVQSASYLLVDRA